MKCSGESGPRQDLGKGIRTLAHSRFKMYRDWVFVRVLALRGNARMCASTKLSYPYSKRMVHVLFSTNNARETGKAHGVVDCSDSQRLVRRTHFGDVLVQARYAVQMKLGLMGTRKLWALLVSRSSCSLGLVCTFLYSSTVRTIRHHFMISPSQLCDQLVQLNGFTRG